MSYEEILILGWNLNVIMFLLNLFFAFRTMSTKTREQMEEENRVLSSLKEEFDKYYPNRKYETILTYLIPFTAFFRMSFRLIEMSSFFSRNKGTTMVDYMIYKYEKDIKIAKNRLS